MYDLDAIEAINFEQLATITDRLLLQARFPKRLPGTSSNHLVPNRPFARGSRAQLEPTLIVTPPAFRPNPPSNLWRRFTTTALITALFSVTAAIVVLL
jgi:hypothetical protein